MNPVLFCSLFLTRTGLTNLILCVPAFADKRRSGYREKQIMKNYTTFKSGGKWFLKTARGKLLAQEFDDMPSMFRYVKMLKGAVSPE